MLTNIEKTFKLIRTKENWQGKNQWCESDSQSNDKYFRDKA